MRWRPPPDQVIPCLNCSALVRFPVYEDPPLTYLDNIKFELVIYRGVAFIVADNYSSVN